jgi:ProP effector
MNMTLATIQAAIALLAEAFPQCFAAHAARRQPLKLGIHADIALAGVMTAREMKVALRYYTGNAAYLRSIRQGAPRVDLEGKPAGTVTAEDEQAAKAKLAARHKPKLAARPKPRRLGLADLKAAAQRRKARA